VHGGEVDACDEEFALDLGCKGVRNNQCREGLELLLGVETANVLVGSVAGELNSTVLAPDLQGVLIVLLH